MPSYQLTPETFLADVAEHQIQVIRDDGVYRHVRFKQPDTYCSHFDLITWPGYLCYTGDMGTYVFTRLRDMFEFFRRPDNEKWHRIDRRYWAEKCEAADRDGIKEFSEEKFKRAVMERLVEWIRDCRDDTTKEERREVWEAVVCDVVNVDGDTGGHRQQAAAYEFSHRLDSGLTFRLEDFWETNVEDYTHRFSWCCLALAWGIQQYDAHTAKTEQAQPA